MKPLTIVFLGAAMLAACDRDAPRPPAVALTDDQLHREVAAGATVVSQTAVGQGTLYVLSVPDIAFGIGSSKACVLFDKPGAAAITCDGGTLDDLETHRQASVED